MSLGTFPIEADFSAQAPLLCNLNLDLSKEEQFQMGNITVAKTKSKDYLKEPPATDFTQ